MNDNEIIKALEKFKCVNCNGDCAKESYEDLECPLNLAKSVLDLINRQKAENAELQHKIASCNLENVELKAEIDRLLRSLNETNKYISKIKERAKSEAIKEFAERLKITDMSSIVGETYINGEMYSCFDSGAFGRIVDNLVKEMTE